MKPFAHSGADTGRRYRGDGHLGASHPAEKSSAQLVQAPSIECFLWLIHLTSKRSCKLSHGTGLVGLDGGAFGHPRLDESRRVGFALEHRRRRLGGINERLQLASHAVTSDSTLVTSC